MKTNKDFCVVILTHGRPNNVVTEKTLRSCGYTGKIFYIVDDEDKTKKEYMAKYGSDVILFSKKEIAETTDSADNFKNYSSVLFARNASFSIVKNLGYKYFVQLDDDYNDFRFKYDLNGKYGDWRIKNLDRTFETILKYFIKTNCLSIAIAQGGDFIIGKYGKAAIVRSPKRKAMNSFFCSVDRPFKFIGILNDDVNTYTRLGNEGHLFLTLLDVALQQAATQTNEGGLTDIYLTYGTYVKSFYTVMICPSCVKINLMGTKFKRLHHKIKWNNAVPKILSEDVRKNA